MITRRGEVTGKPVSAGVLVPRSAKGRVRRLRRAAAVNYRIRGVGGEWLAATLDPGERLEIECGPVRARFGLGEIYEDTGLMAA